MSWDEGFAAHYERWSAAMTDDVPFYVDLARRTDGPIVELAVGDGRVAIPVARTTNRVVIGIDTSHEMLDRGRRAAADAGVALDLRHGDICDLVLEEPAGLIYCPFRSLQHVATWSERRGLFERVAASLRPGGRFAFDAIAFDHHLAAARDDRHQEEPVPHTLHYDVADNRIDITLDGAGTSSLWWATRNEWLGLADVAGLDVEALYGSFDRRPIDGASREYVVVTTRPV